jgi:uncharacterized membrane protein YbhN (UPF0104 family)
MRYALPYKTKQFFVLLIKLSIVIGAFYFVYIKLAKNENLNLSDFIHFLSKNETFSLKNVIFLIILSIFNWFFEILKWQQLVLSVKKISFRVALEQSLAGLTASFITPNRIGDYGAKVVYFKKNYRGQIALLNLLGHMAQMTITILLGTIGLLLFISKYQIKIDYLKILLVVFIFLGLAFFATLSIRQLRIKIKGFSLHKIFSFLKKLPIQTHVVNLGLSLLRYIIFSFQFFLLLHYFGIELPYSQAMVIICSMYLLASIVPTLSFFDVIIKGSVAVFLFNYIPVNELTILSVTTLMWILNFVLSGLLGSYFVLNFKLPNQEE